MAEASREGRLGTRRRKLLGLAASAVLVVAGGLAVWQATRSPEQRPRPIATPVDPTPDPTPAATPAKKDAKKPRRAPRDEAPTIRLPPGRAYARGPSIGRVVIPSIGVRAPIIKAGLNRDRSLKVPADPDETGWWTDGVKAGRRGTAVIVGHVDSTRGPAVFNRLGALSKGDRVKVVHNDGSRAAFVVTGRERVPKNSFPTLKVYARTREPSIRLITCGGEFNERRGHYTDNVIVYGRAA